MPFLGCARQSHVCGAGGGCGVACPEQAVEGCLILATEIYLLIRYCEISLAINCIGSPLYTNCWYERKRSLYAWRQA